MVQQSLHSPSNSISLTGERSRAFESATVSPIDNRLPYLLLHRGLLVVQPAQVDRGEVLVVWQG